MKAFQFRLDPALRWRSTQLRLEQEAVSRAGAHLSALQTELMTRYTELRSGSSELAEAGSAAFQSWAAYLDRTRRRIRALEEQIRQAQQALAAQTRKMVDAHRNLKVIENLKHDDHADWIRELGRETEAFAGEAHLAKMFRESRGAGSDAA